MLLFIQMVQGSKIILYKITTENADILIQVPYNLLPFPHGGEMHMLWYKNFPLATLCGYHEIAC